MTTIDRNQPLKGRVALVTATGQGIGRAIAERLQPERAPDPLVAEMPLTRSISRYDQ